MPSAEAKDAPVRGYSVRTTAIGIVCPSSSRAFSTVLLLYKVNQISPNAAAKAAQRICVLYGIRRKMPHSIPLRKKAIAKTSPAAVPDRQEPHSTAAENEIDAIAKYLMGPLLDETQKDSESFLPPRIWKWRWKTV